MKILHVVHGYAPALGGSERLMQRVSENLVARYQDDVTVLTANGYNNEAFVDPAQPVLPAGHTTLNGVEIERFPVFNKLGKPLFHLQNVAYGLRLPGNQHLRTLYNGPILPGLGRRVETAVADVVAAAAFPLLHMFTTLKACRRSGKPVVLIGALHPLNEWGYQRPMIYDAIRQADAYIALSDYERHYLIDEKQINPAKIHVIGSGVEVARFAQGNGRFFREQYEIGERPLVGFIGQQGRNKGVDTLIMAMKQVWQSVPDAHLLIAGARTAYTPHLQALIASELTPQAQQRITYLHNFLEDEKPDLFAACDIFAYPSRFESFGIAFIEAWAAGRPVVGCAAGAVPTVVADGVDGLLVPVDDAAALAAALTQLLQSPARRQQLGAAGQAKVHQHYTWGAVTAQWRAVYEAVWR